jgi:deaminated glutathione amidase
MRVSVLQMSPGQDKAANLAQAQALLDGAVGQDGADMIGLPEVWSYLGGDRAAKFDAAEVLPRPGEDAKPGTAYALMRDAARGRGVFVHGGSIIERDGETLFNTTVAFDPDGAEVARYRKIHLFDITTPDGTVYGESRSFGAGSDLVTYAARGLRVGCAICYDVRFAELFLALRRAGAELVFLPSVFTLETGKDHWEVLIRARAIETQCWFAAPATYTRRTDANPRARDSYGHSLICDPWGHVVAKATDGAGWATAHVDAARAAKIRADMPVMDHRKLA